MARLFPTYSACRFDTTGERRLAQRLLKKLEDDYLCWFNVPVGPKALQPDVVLLHPLRGVLVLEVKDWKLDTIQSMDRGRARLFVDNRLRTVTNPMMQARAYALEVAVMLQKDPVLCRAAGTSRAGQLVMPYGWGVVMTRVTRCQFEGTDLAEVLDPEHVIFQDEMIASVDPEAFQQRLWNMFPRVFPCHLTLPQVNRVRWHLYPQVRVNQQHGQFGLFADSEAALPSLIKVMDLQQEQLARSLGGGHRVIHGVAGSGKTMILGYRCQYLAQAATKPILVLCYNKSLASRLRQLLDGRGLAGKVLVRNFHGWCSDMLRAYHVERPVMNLPVDERMRQLVERTIGGVDRGHIPRAQYAAVLIDEGHDFRPEWFKLVVQMIDPHTDTLLVLYDDAQSIYHHHQAMDFSFASVGIQAKGRTTILQLNYRNTFEVLAVARAFANELLTGHAADEDGVPVVAPESAGRRGAFPELIRCQGAWQETQCVVERLIEAHDEGRAFSDMAVIYRDKYQVPPIEKALREAGVAVASAVSSKDRAALYDARDAVKIVSMHSSKGLEFGLVLIPGLGLMPMGGADEADEARLLYVAMTRAVDRLVMTWHRSSAFTQRVRDSIHDVRGELAEGSAA